MRRREFLRGLGAAGLVAALPSTGLSLTRAPRSGPGPLILVELLGGNDGLNTVIPFADDIYHRSRSTLAIPERRVLQLDDATGLHPNLTPLKELWDDGELAIVRGVGYPSPNRSHFRSRDIWHSAVPDRVDTREGWLGRVLSKHERGRATELFVLGRTPTPLAFRGAPRPVITVESLDDLSLSGGSTARARIADAAARRRTEEDLEMLRTATRDATALGDRLERAKKQLESTATTYPSSPFGRQLRLVSALLSSGFEQAVYWVGLNGFDTHARQDDTHPVLMRVLAQGLGALHADLKKSAAGRRATTVVFSEFGRRVAENASRGTDHGAAAPVLLAGPRVKAGFHGAPPNLGELDEGDVRHHTDFRNIWAALARDVLGVKPERDGVTPNRTRIIKT